jgi:hypothetical protein
LDNESLPYRTSDQLFLNWLNDCARSKKDTWYVHDRMATVHQLCDQQELEAAAKHCPFRTDSNCRKDEARPLTA